MPNSKDRDNRTPLTPMSRDEIKAMREAQLSRRKFLRRSSGVAAVAVGAGTGTAVVSDSALTQDESYPPAPFEYAYDGVPEAPETPPSTAFEAFSEEQAAMVEALTAQFIPGTPDDPGAREAGVVHYIDFILSTNSGIHEPTYTHGPFAKTYEGDNPPEEDDENTIWVKESEISRYGYQAPLSPLQVYEIGLQAVQDYAREQYGSTVPELDEGQLEQIIWDLLDDKVPGFEQFPPSSFFHTLRRHTAEGMFCDPSYGGNQNLIGWNLVGFPGAQRAYSVEALHSDDPPRPPQGLRDLPHFHPGVPAPNDGPNVIQPVRESEVDEQQVDGDEVPDVDDMNQDQEGSPVSENGERARVAD